MNVDYEELKDELDRAIETAEKFVVNYSARMQCPVNLLKSVVSGMSKTEDAIVNQAHLETLQRTLLQMDGILIELMNTLTNSQRTDNAKRTE